MIWFTPTAPHVVLQLERMRVLAAERFGNVRMALSAACLHMLVLRTSACCILSAWVVAECDVFLQRRSLRLASLWGQAVVATSASVEDCLYDRVGNSVCKMILLICSVAGTSLSSFINM